MIEYTKTNMIHLFEKGTSNQTLILLHGNGGDEHDLLSVAHMIDRSANILSIRGPILEYGMPRFYKRKSYHDLDTYSLIEQTHELRDFIDEAIRIYHLDYKKITIIGYSDGANIAVSILFHYECTCSKAILFHPMVPLRHIEMAKHNNLKVFIGAGRFDHMMPEHEVHELTQLLESIHADVEVFWTDYGHQLSKEEIIAAKVWYEEKEGNYDDDI